MNKMELSYVRQQQSDAYFLQYILMNILINPYHSFGLKAIQLLQKKDVQI